MRAAFLLSPSSITRGRMGTSKAALILMKNSHLDRTLHTYIYFLLTGSFGRLATDGGSRANGEIVVYQILEESDDDRKTKKKFRICSRISNKPSDSVGCWFGNKYVISSDFKWLAHLVSSSKLWMNKVQRDFFYRLI